MSTFDESGLLEEIAYKVVRATEGIDSLAAEIVGARSGQGYEFWRDFDPETGNYTVRFILDKLWLLRLGVLTGEILHNLRSALDHLADVLVRSNGGTPTETTHFPIWVTNTGKKSGPKHLGVVGGVSTQALTLIESLQPYQPGGQGANNPLAVLAQLNNIDKHRNILLAGGFLAAHTTYFEHKSSGESVLSILGGLRFNDGAVVATWGIIQEGAPPYREEEVEMYVEGAVSVELRDGVWAGRELVGTLRDLTSAVIGTFTLFRALEI